ncbi:MAG: prohibitin family protein [Elusimicrobia bacterium]|nr:prohibitin family protein [Elusimicrobiota bacterium]
MQKDTRLLTGIITVVVLALIAFSSFFVVEVGSVGVRINVITGQTKSFPQGTYAKIPFVHQVVNYDVKTQKQEVEADSASKDLQTVRARIVVNFRPVYEKVNDIHIKIGKDYFVKVIYPAIQEVSKTAISKLPVENIIVERENLRAAIEQNLRKKIEEYNIIIENVNIVDIQFTAEFNRVVEEKQIEEQKVKKIQYQRMQAEEEKKRVILLAEAEAQKQKLLRDSSNQTVINLKWIEKWDGHLPKYMLSGNKSNAMFMLPDEK